MAAFHRLDEDEEYDDVADVAETAEAALSHLSHALLASEAAGADAVEASHRLKAAAAAADAAKRACREFELEAGEQHRPQQFECSRRLQQLLGTLEFLRSTRQRELLLANGRSGGPTVDADKMSPAALIELGAKVQNESAQAVMRMTRLVEASRETGAQTLNTLEGHRSRLERVRATVTAQVYQFEMAEKEMEEFALFVRLHYNDRIRTHTWPAFLSSHRTRMHLTSSGRPSVTTPRRSSSS